MSRLNLLPPQEKETIQKYIYVRIIYAAAFIVFLFAVTLGVILFSAKQFIEIQNEALQERTGVIEDMERTEEVKSLEVQINEVNTQLKRMDEIKEQDTLTPVEVLEQIAPLVPENVNLTNFSYSTKTNTLNLRGHADQRVDVITMENNLEEDSLFTDIDSPISNKIEPRDINFRFNIQVSDKQENS